MNSHPDLDYYDVMTLDELREAYRSTDNDLNACEIGEALDYRRARRDAILDMAEALDAEGLVLVSEEYFRQIELLVIPDRDADHG